MRDNDQILTLQETERLCRMYLDCRLSALEEQELRYVLERMDAYHSEVVDEARESMAAEGLLSAMPARKAASAGRSPWRRWMRLAGGVAASVAVVVALSVVVREGASGPGTETALMASGDTESVSIAYEGGRRLSPADAEKAVEESMKRADELLAMAAALDHEEMKKMESLIQMTNEKL